MDRGGCRFPLMMGVAGRGGDTDGWEVPLCRQEADLRRTVEESSRIQSGYGHYFDLSLVNTNLERTFRELQAAMEKLRTQPQWVPVSWVY